MIISNKAIDISILLRIPIGGGYVLFYTPLLERELPNLKCPDRNI